jgi:hypothetical protein
MFKIFNLLDQNNRRRDLQDTQYEDISKISPGIVASRQCPSFCSPIPMLEIPIDSLSIPFLNPSIQLTCSLNLDMMLNHSMHFKKYNPSKNIFYGKRSSF